MKKLLLLSIMLFSVLFANAQNQKATPEEMAQKRVNKLTEQLNLSSSQQTDIYDLYLNQILNRKAKGKKHSTMTKEDRMAFKADRKAAIADFENEMAVILSPEQLETYKSLKTQKNRRNKGKIRNTKGKKGKVHKSKVKSNKSPEERAQKKVDKLTEKLALNASQQERVYTLLLNRTTKVKGQNKKELSKEERAILKENRKQDKANFDAEMANILSPEQLDIYENMKAENKGKKKSKGKRKSQRTKSN